MAQPKTMTTLGLSVAALLVGPMAEGDTKDADLGPSIEWDAPAACPTAGDVGAAVHALLGKSPTSDASARLAAKATVTQDAPDRFTIRMQLDTNGASETKSMDADNCGTLADAFALVIAFTLDPSASPSIAGRPLVSSPRFATSSADTGARQVDVGKVPHDRGLRIAGGPHAETGVGLLPFPAYGIGATIAVEGGIRAELSGTYWPQQSNSVDVQPSLTVGAQVRLASLRPSVCIPLDRGLVGGVTALCAGIEVGAMYATGTGVPSFKNGTSWWLAPRAGVAVRASVGDAMSFRFRLDIGMPVFRPRFVLENVGAEREVEAFTPALVFGTLTVEPEFRFFSTGSREAGHVHP